MKRVFGVFEAVFDVLYLCAALVIGLLLLFAGKGEARFLAGLMALTLMLGDSFHLVPRVNAILTMREGALLSALGRGKQIASISMTVFYVFLYHVGLLLFPQAGGALTYAVYALAAVRIALCLFKQNAWEERYPPVSWGVWRNIPFFLLGLIVSALFLMNAALAGGLKLMWLAVLLSFAFYLPVVLWVNKNPRLGMLMLPKTLAYIWMLLMCLTL